MFLKKFQTDFFISCITIYIYIKDIFDKMLMTYDEKLKLLYILPNIELIINNHLLVHSDLDFRSFVHQFLDLLIQINLNHGDLRNPTHVTEYISSFIGISYLSYTYKGSVFVFCICNAATTMAITFHVSSIHPANKCPFIFWSSLLVKTNTKRGHCILKLIIHSLVCGFYCAVISFLSKLLRWFKISLMRRILLAF